MNNHFELSNLEFSNQLENCTLDASLFNHEAHLRLAWIYLNKYDLKVATKKICDVLFVYDRTVGAGMKYNNQLTVAATEIVHYFMTLSSKKNFELLLKEFPRLKYDFKKLVKTNYNFETRTMQFISDYNVTAT